MKFALLIILFSALGAKTASAQQQTNFPPSRLSFYQILYAGEKGKSLSETGVGYGVEIERSSEGNGYYSFYLKVRGSYSSGTQSFADGTANVSSKFTFYQGDGELGVYLFPLQRQKSGLNVYVGGGGIAGYNYLSLDKSTTVTTIPLTDQAIGTGFSAVFGGEFLMRGNMKAYSLNAQLAYKHETAKLLKQSEFDLSGIALVIGLGF